MASAPTMRNILSQPPQRAAREILGWELVRVMPDGEIVTCRIVETEAYHESEPGCHAYKGRTKRNEAMFMRAGHAYIYFIYGMHYCLNISCGKEGEGAAVLLRAAEPIAPPGLNLSGPALLCASLKIDRGLYGTDMLSVGSSLRLHKVTLRKGENTAVTGRIGLSSGQAPDLPWRLYIEDNKYVSRRSRQR